jgi:hypothetical protein
MSWRWRRLSRGCWRCARGLGWCRWGWSRSTAACWRATPRRGGARLRLDPRGGGTDAGRGGRGGRRRGCAARRGARGDELPAELVDARSRRERLRRCEEQLERAQADEEAAYQAKLAWPAAGEAEHGRRLAGRKPQNPPQPDDARARPRRPPPSAPTAHGRRTGNRKPPLRGFVQQPLCGAFGPIRL